MLKMEFQPTVAINSNNWIRIKLPRFSNVKNNAGKKGRVLLIAEPSFPKQLSILPALGREVICCLSPARFGEEEVRLECTNNPI